MITANEAAGIRRGPRRLVCNCECVIEVTAFWSNSTLTISLSVVKLTCRAEVADHLWPNPSSVLGALGDQSIYLEFQATQHLIIFEIAEFSLTLLEVDGSRSAP